MSINEDFEQAVCEMEFAHRLNKLKFYYEHDEDLTHFIEWLGSMAVKVKHTEKRGRFKKAYILLKSLYKQPNRV